MGLSKQRIAILFCLSCSMALGQSATSSPAEQYAAQGRAALAAGDYVQAEMNYEKLRQLEPGVAEVHATLGVIYFQERKFDQAVSELRQAMRLKPSLPKVDGLLAMSLSELGHYREALPGLEKTFRQTTEPPVKRMCGLQLERAYTGLHADNKAVQVALELDSLFPNDPEILYHNERIYGNYAYLTIQKLIKVAPDSIWKHQAAAEALEAQGSNDSAIAEYRQILAIDPHRLGIHYRLGRTLLARYRTTLKTADVAEALQEFQLELDMDPANANAAYEIGAIHQESSQLEQARTFFEEALRSHPDFPEAQLGLGTVLQELQKPDEALPHLKQAVALDPLNDVAWYRLSQVQRALGNAAEQRAALK